MLCKLGKVLTVAIPGCDASNYFLGNERLQVEVGGIKVESNLLVSSTVSKNWGLNIRIVKKCVLHKQILQMKTLQF